MAENATNLQKISHKFDLSFPWAFLTKRRNLGESDVENSVESVENRKDVRRLLTNSNICCIFLIEHLFEISAGQRESPNYGTDEIIG